MLMVCLYKIYIVLVLWFCLYSSNYEIKVLEKIKSMIRTNYIRMYTVSISKGVCIMVIVCVAIGQQVDLESVATHVVAALFKEFLRNIPGGLLPSSRYTVLVASNDCRDTDDRAVRISRSVFVLAILFL